MSNFVFHKTIDEHEYINRGWGVYNKPMIVSENMEMHLQKISAKSIGIPHMHKFNTVYYVTTGYLISLSGDDLSHVDMQPKGSCVFVPKNVIHTLANASDIDAISIVAHDNCDVAENTIIMHDLEELARQKIFEISNSTPNFPQEDRHCIPAIAFSAESYGSR